MAACPPSRGSIGNRLKMPTKMLMKASIRTGTTQSKFGCPAIITTPTSETGREAASSEVMSTSAEPANSS